jgi:rod shape determining protein RodA
MATIGTTVGYQIDTRKAVSKMDWPLLMSSVVLLLFGLMSLYSIGLGQNGTYFKKQLLYVLIGLGPFALFTAVHPGAWRKGANWLYVTNLLLLMAVLVIGRHTNGAGRWISLPGGIEFQPSEPAKLLTIITLSSFYANRHDRIMEPSTFFLGLLHVIIPVLLIKAQPHLGAVVVIMVMWFAVSLVAGIPAKTIGAFCAVAAVAFGIGLRIPAFRAHLLESYQEKRVQGLKAAHGDRKGKPTDEVKLEIRGTNYQTDRAEIAFGVGSLAGTGFGRGEQKAAKFIPEQHDDFILTVIGEEGGLIGCTLLLLAYGYFFYRIFLILLHATEPYHRMLAAGVFAVLGAHMFANMGMVLQLLPVVGLWLPFLSYGGTAIWLCMACVGLMLSVRRRQRPLLF